MDILQSPGSRSKRDPDPDTDPARGQWRPGGTRAVLRQERPGPTGPVRRQGAVPKPLTGSLTSMTKRKTNACHRSGEEARADQRPIGGNRRY